MREAQRAMLSTVIVGGGPGGLGPLVWAAQQGLLARWLQAGLALVERQDHLGGTLGRFAIHSDSLGGSYLEFLEAGGFFENFPVGGFHKNRRGGCERELTRTSGFPYP